MLGKILFAAIAVKVVDKTLDKIIKSSSTHKPASRGPISPTGVDGPIGVTCVDDPIGVTWVDDVRKGNQMDKGHLTRGLAAC